MMNDHTLDALAERFISNHIRQTLKISFQQYLTQPEKYDGIIAAFKAGKAGICIHPFSREPKVVTLS
ncbi:MAG: hypothetical protein SCI25_00065 [Desulfuromonadales bacterium]|nr:hypothetical protein [Desulfuromonadales bacterium]